MSGYRFELKDGAVDKIDVLTCAVVSRHSPVGTKVVQVLAKGNCLIIREDYYQFPQGSSNIYCLNQDLELLWEADLPSPTDVYANALIDRGNTLECGSWEGSDCVLDPETGKMIRNVFGK